MDIEKAIAHFGSQSKLAERLDVSLQVVGNWRARKSIPKPYQYLIENISGGKLKRTRGK
jgi:DNA-binding transcriptional regulator YiaG